jgi:hypothetical protein
MARPPDPLRAAFDTLLRALEETWPAASIAYVREEVGHREYGEALENLMALALRDGHTLDPGAFAKVEQLATRMGLEDSPHLLALRRSP